MVDAFFRPETLFVQLEALRNSLFRVCVAFLISCVVCAVFIYKIMYLLQLPLQQYTTSALSISGPGDIYDLLPRVIFVSAFTLTVPYLMFEIFLFVAPGLMPKSRRIALVVQLPFLFLSLAGLLFGYYVILPMSLSAAYNLTTQFGVFGWGLSTYFSFSSKILILSTFVVYYPFILLLVSLLFGKPNLPFRIIFLISFVLATAITPGTMILIDLGLAVLLASLYIPTYLIIKYAVRNTPARV